MSRTFRRKQERHEYRWVLREWSFADGVVRRYQVDPKSAAGRRAIAKFHSDKACTMRCGPPHRYRKFFQPQLDTSNDRMLRRCLANPAFDPVFAPWHKHNAMYAWW
jgi:hypothetical protein